MDEINIRKFTEIILLISVICFTLIGTGLAADTVAGDTLVSIWSEGQGEVKLGISEGIFNPVIDKVTASEIIYYVKPGDSLYKIALEFATTVERLKEVNNLQSNLIYIGQQLVIPVQQEGSVIYTVKPGDTLYLIAVRFKTSVAELKAMNGLESDMIYIGQSLILPGNDSGNDNEGQEFYFVKPGDSLYLIARKYGVTISYLKVLNGLESDLIFPGQMLKIKPIPEEVSGSGIVEGKVIVDNETMKINSSTRKTDEKVRSIPLSTIRPSSSYQASEMIVKFKPQITPQDQGQLENDNELQAVNEINTNSGKIVQYRLPEGKEVDEVVAEYSKLPAVEWAEPNYIYMPTAVPADSYYGYQWNYIDLNLEAAWDLEKGSKDVTVALLDTGIIPGHPDLAGNLLPGVDFVGGENTYPVSSYKRTDNDPTDETERSEGGSHGTHVAGIIGAVTGNNRGTAGINWQINLLPVRVLKKTGGTSWDIAEGIYYAIDQGVDIINLSLGGNDYSNLQAEAIKEAYDNGITIVAATGNNNSAVFYPAAFPETIAVGAVDRNNVITYYSNYGPEVDVVAPGGASGYSIYSTWGYYEPITEQAVPGYVGMVGTSMATPHVSGVAALLIAHGVTGPENIRERLTSTARDLGPVGRDDQYGYGLVDAYGALLGKKLANPQVFAAEKQGDTLNLKSEIVNSNQDGTFRLEKVESGESKVFAWRDVNSDNIIDAGDYYGVFSRSLQVDETPISGVNFTVNYISDKDFRLYVK